MKSSRRYLSRPMTDLSTVRETLLQASSVVVVMHTQPDGDTTGSALGLAQALDSLGKEVAVVCQDPVAARFQFLPGSDTVKHWNDVATRRFDVAVTVDCGDDSRVGEPERLYRAAPTVVNIDHHTSNRQFGHINWIDGAMSSTGDMVARLIQSTGVAYTKEMAVCLYTAISTDTGSFRQTNTRPETFAVVNDLLATGFDLREVNHWLWESQPWSETRLLGWALSHSELVREGQVAYLSVSRRTLRRLSATDDSAEALIQHLNAVNTVRIAIVTRETSVPSQIKVSWRGKKGYDVSQLARQFGGGGHRYSAAAVVTGRLAEVTARVVQAAGDALA